MFSLITSLCIYVDLQINTYIVNVWPFFVNWVNDDGFRIFDFVV